MKKVTIYCLPQQCRTNRATFLNNGYVLILV